jgi:cbb3-type cytochrome oxidase maturation protein|tara:strand:+ start:4438 stop:4641 length:204 start_codon:yes stop_codon:yes gene_type:complete
VSIIYVLIPLAIILVAVALGIFFWAVKSDQFQDLERQGYSILFDDDLPEEERNQQAKAQDKANNDNE